MTPDEKAPEEMTYEELVQEIEEIEAEVNGLVVEHEQLTARYEHLRAELQSQRMIESIVERLAKVGAS